jgi:transketolase
MVSRRELANAVRFLSVDAIQKAHSGHPGAPMGMADIAEVLFNDFLNHNPANPGWPNRDRFVVSNGHASMMLYALLHLSGYAVSIDDIKQFRQLGSSTPGHPENELTPGVETTTGPLGQGLGNAVGMALAESILAARYNRPDHTIVDHHTYVFAGDGCLMEGISHEVCSLAGTLGLGKLIVFYDDNGISIDGETKHWFTDDTAARFAAYGWQVIADVDGHDPESIKAATIQARKDHKRPTLIDCKTTIGFGAPTLAGKAKTHGSPLGEAEIAGAREKLGWPHPPFVVPQEIYDRWDVREKGQATEEVWQKRYDAYCEAHPDLAAELAQRLRGEPSAAFNATIDAIIDEMAAEDGPVATRKSSQAVLEKIGPGLPALIGGSADLTPSNNTTWSGSRPVTGDRALANYVHFGVREFGMSAIANGLALYGGFIPYVGTFLVFSDYARNAVRMASLMGAGTIFVYTHDSVGLGEDGPTHQPIEQAAGLRLIPKMSVWRPANALETAVAWKAAVQRRKGPTALLLTRQKIEPVGVVGPKETTQTGPCWAAERGGYILRDCEKTPDAIIIAAGSEVAVAVAAAEQLAARRIKVRVVSMPSTDTFDRQPAAYRENVLPNHVRARVAIEAGASAFWYKYVGLDGRVVGLDRFGLSAPCQSLFATLGFEGKAVAETVEALIEHKAD